MDTRQIGVEEPSRPIFRPGDVLFVWGDDFVSDAIEFVTGGPSHCAMFIDELTLVEAQFGRPIGECPLSFYTASDAKTRLEIWRDETLTDAQLSEMVAYAKTLYGIHYDLALIPLEFVHFALGVPIGWYHENGRICSTLICDIAAHVGKHWSKTANPAPVDLENVKYCRSPADDTTVTDGVLNRIYTREADKWETNMEITVSA